MSKAFDRWLECGALLSTLKIMFGGWSQILVPGVVKDQKASHEMMFGLVAKEHERIKRGIERVSIMDDTIKAAEAEGFDEEHTHAALMSILFAGRGFQAYLLLFASIFSLIWIVLDDTTAALLAFVTYELSKRPDLQEEIRREVEEANGPGDLVNLEVLEKCKVLNACIKESLRMRPSAPYGAGRTAFKDFECVYTDAFGQVKKVQVQKGEFDYIFVGPCGFSPCSRDR